MSLPNPAHPAAGGLSFLASAANNFQDFVTDANPTLVGAAFPTVATPFGVAWRGNGASYLSFGARPEIAPTGGNAGSMLTIFLLMNSEGSSGNMGGKVSNWSFMQRVGSSASQQFFGSFRATGDDIRVPAAAVISGLAPFNGKVVAFLTTWDGTTAVAAVRNLTDGGAILRNSGALTGTYPNNASTALNVFARGGAGVEPQNDAVAIIAQGIWGSTALTEAQVDGILADPTQLYIGPDVIAPTLSAATATATSSNAATGGMTTTEPGPGWAVLSTSATAPSVTQVKAGQMHTGAAAAAAATGTLATGANNTVFAFTGLTGGATYFMHAAQDDLVGNASTVISSTSFATPAPDLTAPVLPGPITVTNITQTSFNSAIPVATDNVAVSRYEVSLNGGASWIDKGLTRTHAATGLTPGSLIALRWRAVDSSGNFSTPLSAAVQIEHLGVLGSTILLTTATGENGSGLMYPSVEAGDEGKRFLLAVTRQPTLGVLNVETTGAFDYIGAADSFDFTITVDGVRLDGPNPDDSATATLAFTGADVTAPTLSSPTATATGTTTASGSVTTSEAGPAWAVLSTSATVPTVAQIKAGQNHTGAATAARTATLSTGANASVFAFTGLTAATTYFMHVVQDDAAGNTSARVTSASFATSAAGDSTAPVLTGSITVTNVTQTTFDSAIPVATDNVAVSRYEVSLNGGTSWIDKGLTRTHAATGLTPGAQVELRWRAVDAAGNASTPPLSTVVQMLAATRQASLTLTNDGTVAAANLTNLRWAWWDAAPPNLATAPVASGTGASTNAAGLFAVTLAGTTLTPGQTGTLLIVSSNGIAGSAANRAYCAPVVVS